LKVKISARLPSHCFDAHGLPAESDLENKFALFEVGRGHDIDTRSGGSVYHKNGTKSQLLFTALV
jgi:hypothetical protein